MVTFNRYSKLHESPAGPGDSRPTAQNVIDDENLRGAMQGKTILVTGATAGLGIETVRALATTGATIFMTARNMTKGEEVRQKLLKEDPSVKPEQLILIEMDLDSLASVRDGAQAFKSKSENLNILINNAGLALNPQETTKDGWERQFGVNHLAHFLLFKLVEPLLLKSSTPAFNSRVVSISSLAHRFGKVRFDDYNNSKEEYSPMVAYARSKTANVWMVNEIEHRFGSKGLHGLSLHPGTIDTGLRFAEAAAKDQLNAMMATEEFGKILKSPEQGAATTVVAAICGELEGEGGLFLEDCAVSGLAPPDAAPVTPGYAEWAHDEQAHAQLWNDSLEFVKEYL